MTVIQFKCKSHKNRFAFLFLSAQLWMEHTLTKRTLETYFRLSHVTGTGLQCTVAIMLPAAVIQGHDYYRVDFSRAGHKIRVGPPGRYPNAYSQAAKTKQTCLCFGSIVSTRL